MSKIIAMSVYGSDPKYLDGAIENAKLVQDVYPGWTMRVYYGAHGEPFDTSELERLGCEVVTRSRSRMHSGMFWRFLAAWDMNVERVIFRDTDSRLNVREAACVKAWEESGLDAHEIKDHPHHSRLPMSGGMWGIVTGVLPISLMVECKKMCTTRQRRVRDMHWLRDRVHPLIAGSMLRHSSVKTPWPCVPFPAHEPYEGFVGQQHEADGSAVWPEGSRNVARCNGL